MDNIIYLDHQASTPLAPGVLDKMLPFLEGNSANPHSSHLLGMLSQRAIEEARHAIADLFNVDGSEIYFTSGATEANNLAIKGVFQATQSASFITCTTEHKCVLATARHIESQGHSVVYVGVDNNGYVDVDDLECKIAENKPKLLSLMFSNNEIGTIQDIRTISKLCGRYGVLLHSDMSQAITHSDISLRELGVNLASISAHKMNGPKGIGAIYISHETKDQIGPIIHGGGQEFGMRSGTLPTPLCVGFGEAARHWRSNGQKLRTELALLRNELWRNLKRALPESRLIGPNIEDRHVSNLNIHVPGVDAEMLLGTLSSEIAASTGSACTSGIPEPSHVVKAVDSEAASDGTVRLSVGVGLNTDAILRAANLIGDAVRQRLTVGTGVGY
ncbi:cysteine desulfurase family protein [Kordiimonas sp.]|uniref:cysteine desulfurase family protein n=1 Tax=Kordiimonas sp. TaxID=1970157 RepID=UPI003A8D90BB